MKNSSTYGKTLLTPGDNEEQRSIGMLQVTASQRVGHNLATEQQQQWKDFKMS